MKTKIVTIKENKVIKLAEINDDKIQYKAGNILPISCGTSGIIFHEIVRVEWMLILKDGLLSTIIVKPIEYEIEYTFQGDGYGTRKDKVNYIPMFVGQQFFTDESKVINVNYDFDEKLRINKEENFDIALIQPNSKHQIYITFENINKL